MRMRGWEIAFGLIFLVIGILVVIQVRTSMATIQQFGRGVTAQQMATQLKEAKDENASLKYQVGVLAEQLNKKTSDPALDTLRQWAGLKPVEGPGITVKIGIIPDGYTADANALAWVANNLRTQGARAISLNGIRLVGTTGIGNSATETILVGGVPITPPYEFVAVGEPNALQAATTFPDSQVSYLKADGIPVTVQMHKEKLKVPAWIGDYHEGFANDTKKEGN